MGAGTDVDLVTLIVIIVMVCVATFSCTIFGRFCFDKYWRRSSKSKACTHGGLPDLPCGVCLRLGTDPDVFARWRPYHPAVYPNMAPYPPNLNYAALLAAERQNTYLATFGHPGSNVQNASPGATDLLETQKELPGPLIVPPMAMSDESGTFKRLGIRDAYSYEEDINGIARQLENRNLSPIQQTPPDTNFPTDLSIAQTKSTHSPMLKASQTFKQRRSNSFHQNSAQKENTYNIGSMTAKSVRGIQIPGIKKMFGRNVGASDLNKVPRSSEGRIIKPSPIHRKKIHSGGDRSSPILTKAKPVSPESQITPHTAIEKTIDEVDVLRHIGAPGNTTPVPLSVRKLRAFNPSDDEEVFKPPLVESLPKPPRITAGGKIRTFRHRSLNDAGGIPRQQLVLEEPRSSCQEQQQQMAAGASDGLCIKRFKSLENEQTATGLVPNFCSYCGQYLMQHSKSRNGTCSEIDRKNLPKPSFDPFQQRTDDNMDETEKTSSNSLGSPGMTSIIDSLNVATARNSCVSKNFDEAASPPENKQQQGYINIPISEAEKFSLELERRGPLQLSESMFKIPAGSPQNPCGGESLRASATPNRKSFDVESSVKRVKSPMRIASFGGPKTT